MTVKVTTPSDTEICISRWFDAPRRLVYRALTDGAILRRWLEPPGFVLTECVSDTRAGGTVRFAWKGDAGGMAVTILLKAVVPDRKIVGRETFDEAWYPGDAIVTQELTDQDGGTMLAVTIRYETKAARDGVLQTPMTDGMGQTYDQLEKLLGILN